MFSCPLLAPMPQGIVVIDKPWNYFNCSAHAVWIDYLASKGWIDDPAYLKQSVGAYVYHGKWDQFVPYSKLFSIM